MELLIFSAILSICTGGLLAAWLLAGSPPLVQSQTLYVFVAQAPRPRQARAYYPRLGNAGIA